MTTDTKAVARWDIGINGLSDKAEILWHYQGRYILFTDHERIVEEIGLLWARELVKRDDALAASRAEVEENENVINVWRGRAQRAEAEAKGLSQSLTDSLECEEDYLREISELRAEVEGLKKDAERYRWLQKQTPYRFGKIQAACVIDAVDTLYFKADEFDAQIDAAMENGNV